MTLRRERLATTAAAIMVVVIAVVVWTGIVRVLRSSEPITSPLVAPKSLVWNGRVFSDQPALVAWLAARGIHYAAWAKSHPAAAAVFDPRAAASTTTTKAAAADRPTAATASPRRETAGGGSSSSHLTGLLASLAILCALAALTLPFLLRRGTVPERLAGPVQLIAREPVAARRRRRRARARDRRRAAPQLSGRGARPTGSAIAPSPSRAHDGT